MSAPRPTILIDATPLRTPSGIRGIGRYVFELMHGLEDVRDQWEADLRIVALEGLTRTGAAAIRDDLRAAADDAISDKGKIPNPTMRLRRQLWLGRACSKAGANLLHETEALGTPLRCPVPRLVTCYDLIPLRFPYRYLPTPLHYPLQWAKDWRRYATARRVVTISQRTRDDVIKILRMSPDRVEAVVTGIDLGRWASLDGTGDEAALAELGLRGRRFLLYVGYGDYRKNVEGMFGTLARVVRESEVELVWAGALDAKRKRKIEAQARDAGVREHVRLLGYVSDSVLAALFRGAVAHLFLSRLEGFGLSVAEAMAVGCPVIVARGSGADEVAGQAGIIVDPDDLEAAARGVLLLLRDEQTRSRYADACRRQVALFGRASMASGYIGAYRHALASGG